MRSKAETGARCGRVDVTEAEVAEGRRLLADATGRPWCAPRRHNDYPQIIGPNYEYPDKDNVLGYLGRMSKPDLALILFAVNNLDALLSDAEAAHDDGANGPVTDA